MLSQKLVICLSFFLLIVCPLGLIAQAKESVTLPARSKIYVDGKLLPSGKLLVKDGVSYVEAGALAEALGASVQVGASSYLITTSSPKTECDHQVVQGRRFSEQFRSDMAGLADEIESLRAVVLKMRRDKEKERVPLGPRFDQIDRRLSLSTPDVQTDADMAVYYALSYANNSLAISYYQLLRKASDDEAQKKDQLDSMICSMESKFALMKGTLIPGGSCSVFKRMEASGPPKSEQIAHPLSSGPQN